MDCNSNQGISLDGLTIFFCNKQIKYHICNGKMDLNSKALDPNWSNPPADPKLLGRIR